MTVSALQDILNSVKDKEMKVYIADSFEIEDGADDFNVFEIGVSSKTGVAPGLYLLKD